MATSKYELPDETLQLIAASNFANAFSPFNQNVTPSQSAGALKPDNLIKALRAATKAGPGNPGVNLLANGANGKALKTRDYKDQTFHPQILRMKPGVKADVVLPKAETQVPIVPPYVPPYVPPVIPPIVEPPVVVPPVVVEPPVVEPPVVEPPVIVEPPVVQPPVVEPPVVEPPEVEPPYVPSIYTKPIVSSIPDGIDPSTIPLINAPPLELPEIPEVPDKKGIVEIYPGDTVIPEPVGPNRAGGGDLPEDFDKYLIEIANSFGGGTGGGGKYFDDQSMATMAMAKGGKVTRDKLMGPDPAGPDDGFATLKSGEFVLNEKTAKEIGYEVLKRLNDRNK